MALYSIKKNDDGLTYKLEPGSSSGSSGAGNYTSPRSGPSIGNISSYNVLLEGSGSGGSSTIDFVERIKTWTASPIVNEIYKSKIKIPDIQLKEKKLVSSTLWEQFKYFGYVGLEQVQTVAEVMAKYGTLQGLATEALKAIEGEEGEAKGALGALDMPNKNESTSTSEDFYEKIYSIEDTGFTYIFPLFTKEMRSKSGSYSDSYSGDGKGAIEGPSRWLSDFTSSDAQGWRALVEPGLYIEKTQFYNFGRNQDSISFSFPLLNTISQEQIDQNYQFLFLILFQNSLYRKDRSAFIPPCIYEVLVPNIRYMKHAYISSLGIDFLGTRRLLTVNAPTIGGGSLKTIVPEAYNVNITITSLHDEVGNFLMRSGADSVEGVGTPDLGRDPSNI